MNLGGRMFYSETCDRASVRSSGIHLLHETLYRQITCISSLHFL